MKLQVARWGGGLAALIILVGLVATLAATYRISRADTPDAPRGIGR